MALDDKYGTSAMECWPTQAQGHPSTEAKTPASEHLGNGPHHVRGKGTGSCHVSPCHVRFGLLVQFLYCTVWHCVLFSRATAACECRRPFLVAPSVHVNSRRHRALFKEMSVGVNGCGWVVQKLKLQYLSFAILPGCRSLWSCSSTGWLAFGWYTGLELGGAISANLIVGHKYEIASAFRKVELEIPDHATP